MGLNPKRPCLLPAFLGLAALLPFLAYYGLFKRLYWFGDEFPLINEIDTMPFGRWLWYPFVENVLPLFKLLWGSAVLRGSGSYVDLLWAAWFVHAATIGLMALWMQRSGFGRGAIVFCATLAGWSASQVETLTWTVQTSSQLCTLFFVCAALMLPTDDEPFKARRLVALFCFTLASTWSFSRGLLTGPVMAAAIFSGSTGDLGRKKWPALALCLIPALVTGVIMLRGAPENSRHLAADLGHWSAVARFALCYLGGSPALPYWFSTGAGSAFNASAFAVATVGLVKLGIVFAGWKWATKRQRALLLPALFLELGYALLLGLGRWEGDWHYAMGSRYQYNSLLFSLPFLAIVLRRALDRLTVPSRLRLVLISLVIAIFSSYSLVSWNRQLPGWVEWRGLRNRTLLVQAKSVPDGNDVVALPTFPNWRAKQLVDKYHLR